MKPEKRIVTIDDIARKLNIAASTVSRALNNNSRISEKTKKEVWRVAKELGYKLRIKNEFDDSKKNIFVVLPENNSYFYNRALLGMKKIIRQNNYNIFVTYISNSEREERHLLDFILNFRPNGLILSLSPLTNRFDIFDKIIKYKIPVVSFNNTNFNLAVPKIVFDYYQAMFIATNHLLSAGCRNIALFLGNENNPNTKEMVKAHDVALEEKRLMLDKNSIIYSDLTSNDIQMIVNYIFKSKEIPDGIITENNYVALQIISSLKKKNVKVPEDIAVISLGFELFNEFISPSISSVQFPAYKTGVKTAKVLFKEIKYIEAGGTIKSRMIIISSNLVIRSSSMQ